MSTDDDTDDQISWPPVFTCTCLDTVPSWLTSASSWPLPPALLKSRIPVTSMASSLSCSSFSFFGSAMKAPSSVGGRTLCRAAVPREEEGDRDQAIQPPR